MGWDEKELKTIFQAWSDLDPEIRDLACAAIPELACLVLENKLQRRLKG